MKLANFLKEIKFDKDGLVRVITQDDKTNEVLMSAYMNKEALQKTLNTNRMWYWSRSKNKLWVKGEVSGNFQFVKGIYLDCDGDILLFKVKQVNGACHEGYKNCFFRELNGCIAKKAFNPKDVYSIQIMKDLFDVIKDRKLRPKEESYTSSLFKAGKGKIIKKLVEECTELVSEAKGNFKKGLVCETADLLYHMLVLLAYQNVELTDVFDELRRRRNMGKNIPTYKHLKMYKHSN